MYNTIELKKWSLWLLESEYDPNIQFVWLLESKYSFDVQVFDF